MELGLRGGAAVVTGGSRGIANAGAFPASNRAEFICGANIDVDGGHQRSIF